MTIRESVVDPWAPTPLEVTLRQVGGMCVMTLRGELCATSLHLLEREFDLLGCIPCREVVLDMTDLETVDDAGCRVLTGLHHYVQGRGGLLTMAGASDGVRDALAASPIECC
jgi:anti-anti-sigma factor